MTYSNQLSARVIAAMLMVASLLLICPASAVEHPNKRQQAKTSQWNVLPAVGWHNNSPAYRQALALLPQKRERLTALVADDIGSPYYLNSLIYQDTDYLLRHAINPINWTVWSDGVFEQAKAQQQLLFLSIGYSSCHWCHVMEEESFQDLDIARALADRFISVKVDRELSPDVDLHYKQILQAVTGTAGWPITAILNHNGDPLFIGSYLPKPKLLSLLNNSYRLWQANPNIQNTRAASFTALAKSTRRIDSKIQQLDWHAQFIQPQLNFIKQYSDTTHGGLSGKVKFSNPAALLLQLHYLASNDDAELKQALKLQLDNMLASGLYDPVNGGFFRYSTDATWTVPHYEKMAYHQGMMLQVYSRAAQIFGDTDYINVLVDIKRFLKNWLYQTDYGFGSAIDAVSDGKEGGFYLYSRAQLNTLLRAPSLKASPNNVKSYAFADDQFGLILNEPFTQSSIALIQLLRAQSEQRNRPKVDQKTISSWNGMIVVGLLQALVYSKDNEMLEMAEQALLSNLNRHFDQEQGLLYRGSVAASVQNQAAGLEDYAWLAYSALEMYDHSNNNLYLDWAKRLVNAAQVHLFDPQDNSFAVFSQYRSVKLNAGQNQYDDHEMLSAHATMLTVLSKLSRRTDAQQWQPLMDGMTQHIAQHLGKPNGNNFGVAAALQAWQAPRDVVGYFAAGRGKVSLQHDKQCDQGSAQLSAKFTLADGWHINSNQPYQARLTATEMQLAQLSGQPLALTNSTWPQATEKAMAFSDEMLSLYQGQFTVSVNYQPVDKHSGLDLKLSLQACSDEICLLKEQLHFYLPACH